MQVCNQNRGFSLIELLVVVTVFAILVAVSVPIYSQYKSRVALKAATTIIDSNDADIRKFYDIYGTFPHSVNDLNIPGTEDQNNFVYPPLVMSFIGDAGTSNPGECNNASYYSYITNYDGGNFFDGTGNIVLYYTVFIDIKGVIHQYCSFEEFDPGFTALGSSHLFPNCVLLASGPGLPTSITDIIGTACSN